MDSNGYNTPIVIDNGSTTIKAGFAGGDKPSHVFDSVVGHRRRPRTATELHHPEYPCGEVAIGQRDLVDLRYPIQRGIIADWDDMEKLWQYTFYTKIQASPEERPVFMTDEILNPKANREKTTQICFEKYNVPAFYLQSAQKMALHVNGLTSGIVVDSSGSGTRTVPFYEGHGLIHARVRTDIGGNKLDEYMKTLVAQTGNTIEDSTARDLKEKLGYVSQDYKTDLAQKDPSKAKSYQLPDGKQLTIESERFRVPEALFQPSLIDPKTKEVAIHLATSNSILKCDRDIHRDLYSNVILAGGTSMINGLRDRLSKELKALAPKGMEVKVSVPSESKYSAWKGCSMLATLSTFQPMWITKEEYDESGPSVVHRKCE